MTPPAPVPGEARIPKEVFDAPVRGVNLAPGTLGEQIGEGPTLLVFLRHFGCVFCRETVADLRAASEADPTFPPVLFFFQGSPIEGRAFLRRYWPGVRAVADPDRRIYTALGVQPGKLLQMFGPSVFRARRRALDKGHRMGEVSGDAFMMPGVFLARGDRLVWRYAHKHAADHPDFTIIPELARSH